MEASALSAPVGLHRPARPAARLLRLRSDEQLVALFRSGSEEAFGVIHDRYRQRLFAYTRQMLAGSRQDAEDALQDVFMRAYASLQASERPVSLRAWLYRVAHNRCIDQLRRPVPAHSDVFEVSRGPLHDPLAEAERRDDLRRLVSDVRRLPEAQRSALLMREMEGLSYDELSVALETTVPAIKSLLVRARIGLVESREARDVACIEIRRQLITAYDRGVRASGQARRHMRECDGCREYRSELRGMRRSFAALTPAGAGGLGLLAQLGLGGGGGAAAAGGGAAASGTGGGAALLGGGAVVATAGKVVAVVASVAVVTAGAAQEVNRQSVSHKPKKATTAAVVPAARPARAIIRAISPGALAERHPTVASTKAADRSAAAHKAKPRTPTTGTITADDAPPAAGSLTAATTTPVAAHPGGEFTGGMAAPDEPADSSTDSSSTGSNGADATTSPIGAPLPAVGQSSATGQGTTSGQTGSGTSSGSGSTSGASGSTSSSSTGGSSGTTSGSGPNSSPRGQSSPPGS